MFRSPLNEDELVGLSSVDTAVCPTGTEHSPAWGYTIVSATIGYGNMRIGINIRIICQDCQFCTDTGTH